MTCTPLAILVIVLASGCTGRVDGGEGLDAGTSQRDASPDDDAAATAGEVCTILPEQAGCPSGDACDYDLAQSPAELACRPVTHAGRAADECSSNADCDIGWTCAVDVTGSASSCAKFCDSDADCDAPNGRCALGIQGVSTSSILCSQSCTLHDSSGCPAGWGCYAAQPPVPTLCIPAGPGGKDAPCESPTDCKADFGCFSDHKCHRICRVTPPASLCGGILSCTSYSPAWVVGGIEYGVCY